ncbi:hypothetical protein VNI00_012147 [Paramarasmius palmivorus]|uniref:DUF6535 domain-containing protein n=1 Tax=Paramarasmius palmivorus TaxID=297713 RepID=A0AAW0C7I1_9AGAR
MASTSYTDSGPTTMHGRSTTPVEERRSFTTEESLETLLKLVNKYDGGIVKNWKEDIDTLLVFAGLFAAVVTAFAVESNKLLSQDSGDATLPSIGRLLVKRGYEWWRAVTPPPDWFFSDIRVLAAFDDTPDPINLKVYELRALDWATRMFQDSPSMVPHFPKHHTNLPIWETLTESDVQEELRDAKRFRESRAEGLGWYTTVARSPRIPDPGLHSDVGIQVLTFRQYWLTLVDLERVSTGVVRDLKDSIDRFKNLKLDKAIGIRFLRAIFHPRCSDASLESLLPVCQYSWNSYPGVEEDGDERLAFMAVLIKHLQRGDTGRRSCLLTHTSGQEFIRFIHKKVIHHELYEPRGWDRERELRNMLMGEWTKATRSIPGLDPLPNDRPPAEGP